MQKQFQLLALIFSFFVVFSCDSDDVSISSETEISENISEQNLTISSFHESTIDTLSNDVVQIHTSYGNFQDNRPLIISKTTAHNEDTLSNSTEQFYFYEDEFLTSDFSRHPTILHYEYDSNGRFVNLEPIETFEPHLYRIIYNNNNIVFMEKLYHPDSNNEEEILRRTIGEINELGEVLRAGPDQNLDGFIDFGKESTFEYDNNGNLVTFRKWDGDIGHYEYTDVLDTEQLVLDNMYGYFNRRVTFIEALAFGLIEKARKHSPSKHARVVEGQSFVVGEQNYFKERKSVLEVQQSPDQLKVLKYEFD